MGNAQQVCREDVSCACNEIHDRDSHEARSGTEEQEDVSRDVMVLLRGIPSSRASKSLEYDENDWCGNVPDEAFETIPFTIDNTLSDLAAKHAKHTADLRELEHETRAYAKEGVEDLELFDLPELSRTPRGGSKPRAGGNSTVTRTRTQPPLTSRVVVNSLEFDDLNLDYKFFNPCVEPLKTQLLQKLISQLHISQDAHVEPIRAKMGAGNAGMWALHDGSQQFMLKLVRIMPAFMGPSRSPESEKFAKLYAEHPEMVRDTSLAFPCKIFHCLGKSGTSSHDLIVMPWAPGIRFSDFIMHKLHDKLVQDLMRVLEIFGSFLADFHQRYNGLQHGDLTPANIFYDEQGCRFTLADVSDIAPRNPVIQSDTDRFVSGLKLLSNFYGEDLWTQGKLRFETGYNARRSGSRPAFLV